MTRLTAALQATRLAGIASNLDLLARASAHADFRAGRIDTGFIADHAAELLAPTPLDDTAWAILALGEQLHLTTNDPSPWAASDNWRLGGPVPLEWHFEIGGEDHTVLLQTRPDGWLCEAQHLRLISRDEHALTVEIAGAQVTAHLHADGGTRWLQIGADRWRVRALGTFGRPPVRKDLGGARTSVVAAPMPGRIVAVQAALGDAVAPGQIVLRLEAMKMEHNLAADIAGKVAAILVSPGDQVVEGAELLRIDADPMVAT